MFQGLPGSGKTTLAKAMVAADARFVRVNKDDIRLALLGVSKGEKRDIKDVRRDEDKVIARRDSLIEAALMDGKSVISDDTNFSRKHKVRFEALARKYGAMFEVRRIETPIDECIARDAKRPDDECVGRDVIIGMARQAGLLEQEPCLAPVSANPDLPKAIICDLDGTLALFEGKRSPYDASKCDQDDLNQPVAEVVRKFGPTHDVIYLSGREDQFRGATERFLYRHGLDSFHWLDLGTDEPRSRTPQLFMRKTGDHRKDSIVKSELFDAHVRDKYNVSFVLDDRNQVVDMWRSMSLPCFQVAPGNF